MTRHLRAAVIGGGVTGCNILYHLCKAGWTEVALFERRDLTAGATWHSSGHIAHYTRSPKLTQLARETRLMLSQLEVETDQPLGFLNTGSLRLATSAAAFDEFAAFTETAAGAACEAQMVSTAEAASMWPLAELNEVKGALFIPADCRLNAADFTQALARGARAFGSSIHRETDVIGLSPLVGGGWTLHTKGGDWTADHVITASGIFARRTLPILGITLPVAVVSHQYLVTDTVPQIAQRRGQGAAPLPILRQPDIGLNIREEGDGYCISLYEQNASAVFRDGPPTEFGMDLFPEDFESIEAGFEAAMARVPSLAEAGIRSTVHGPMPWSPDFAPIAGPVPGLRNLWVAEAMSYGVTWSGGIAQRLVNWITTGDAGDDMSSFDPRRFGPYATSDWADAQAIATYKGVYGDAKGAAEPQKTPLHDVLLAQGAEFEEVDGCAVARHIPSKQTQLQTGALHAPAAPSVLYVHGAKATRFLGTILQGKLPDTATDETRAWHLSQAGTAVSALHIRRLEKDQVYELEIEAPCPGAIADDLQKNGADFGGVCVDVISPKLSKLILIGPPGAFPSLKDTLPNPVGTHTSLAFENDTVCRATRLPDLNGLSRWQFLHDTKDHRAIFDICWNAIPRVRLLGTRDYADLQIAAAEPVCGREIMSDMTPGGLQIVGFAANENGPLQLTPVRMEAVAQTLPVVGTCLRGPDGTIQGRLLSTVCIDQSFVAFAMICPNALDQTTPLTVRIGPQVVPVIVRPKIGGLQT